VVYFVTLALADAPLPPTLAQWITFWVQVAALALLAAFTIYCLLHLKRAMDEKTISVETSWGGLGGSLGGWSASKSLTWFIATLTAVFLFFTLALYVPGALAPLTEQKKASEKKDVEKASADVGNTGDQGKAGDGNQQGAGKTTPSPTPK